MYSSLEGDRQLSHTRGKLEAVAGLVMPSAALATSTVVAGRLVLVPTYVEKELVRSKE